MKGERKDEKKERKKRKEEGERNPEAREKNGCLGCCLLIWRGGQDRGLPCVWILLSNGGRSLDVGCVGC